MHISLYCICYICYTGPSKHTINASMNIWMLYTAERRVLYKAQLPCLQPRYQLVNCERKQRQKQYKAGITRSHEILHTVWVQVVQYFTLSPIPVPVPNAVYLWAEGCPLTLNEKGNVILSLHLCSLLLDFHQCSYRVSEHRSAYKQMEHIQGVSVKVWKEKEQQLLRLYIW